ncbi:hypothetical protein QU814_12535 [Providencia rettgeri]|uniref:hypothetical protein n=1 Tax=Providencia rettgeri TaxID=587 RepID=UPI000D7040FE|nr:hypothetical protein [Providencia rettgeri]MDM9283984.1 hypothetical protein [Providencia rettgeri]
MKGTSPIEQIPVIMLLVTIAVLFAISYLVTDASLKGTREVSFEIKSDSLDKQYLFWLGIIVPIGVFFYLEYFVFLSNEINFDSAGFSVFFDESKLPLGVLALSPIFGVIVSNIHRTIQTEKQISVSEQKNISDSFYAHHKFIIDEFKSVIKKQPETELEISILSPNTLYSEIYKKSNPVLGANNSVDREFISKIKNNFFSLNVEVDKIIQQIYSGFIHCNKEKIRIVDINNKLSRKIKEIITLCYLQNKDSQLEYYLDTVIKSLKDEGINEIERIDPEEEKLMALTMDYLNYKNIYYLMTAVSNYIGMLVLVYNSILDIINEPPPSYFIETKNILITKLFNLCIELKEIKIESKNALNEYFEFHYG